ncbi:MAG: MFS transporter [Geobacteraceae bacterium]|nr:MFS transporter [Geobacteraceae bacterium]
MAERSGLFSIGFLVINLQFALVTAIAALFFAFSGYLASLGIGPGAAGFIISADALAALLIQPVIAPLVHPGVARRWLLGGSLVFSAALFILAQADSAPLMIAARLLQGAGFICVVSALVTMVVQCIPPEMSGRAFGWISLIRLIPYAVIPLFFDLMKLAPSSFGGALKLAGFAALMPILALALPRARHSQQSAAVAPGLSGMLESLRSPAALMVLLSSLFFFCGYAAVFFYLKQFGVSRGITDASLFFTIATVAMIVIRISGGWLFDRYDKVMMCVAGLFAAALCYALLPACSSSGMFFALAGIAGVGWGVSMPLQAAVMFDISDPRARAMNQNLLMVMMQAGFFLGPLLGGWMISASGYKALFASLAALTLASIIMMAAVRRVVK